MRLLEHDNGSLVSPVEPLSPQINSVELPPSEPQIDDIRTEYHPRSGRAPVIASFEQFGKTETLVDTEPPVNMCPWTPFRTRLDFEMAEFILDAALNERQTKTLFSLLDRVAGKYEEFTITNHDDLKNMWKLASKKCVEVRLF